MSSNPFPSSGESANYRFLSGPFTLPLEGWSGMALKRRSPRFLFGLIDGSVIAHSPPEQAGLEPSVLLPKGQASWSRGDPTDTERIAPLLSVRDPTGRPVRSTDK